MSPDKIKPILRLRKPREQINFLLTNRIPRRLLTRFMGWYSRIQSPALTRVSIFIWRIFARDLSLAEAKLNKFNSLQECFIRELKDGIRPIDCRENVVTSPCDAIVGSCGRINDTQVFQAKGFPYELGELIPNKRLQEKYRNGTYITLRLKSSMYHRFHAPIDCAVNHVNYISGDTWNVNPISLKRIEKLFCKNERAVVELKSSSEEKDITLVPVAAILVASMKFNCLDAPLDLNYKGPNHLVCKAHYNKGDEMGYFQHGSTIIVFATERYQLHDSIVFNKRINMGEPLLIEKKEGNHNEIL